MGTRASKEEPRILPLTAARDAPAQPPQAPLQVRSIGQIARPFRRVIARPRQKVLTETPIQWNIGFSERPLLERSAPKKTGSRVHSLVSSGLMEPQAPPSQSNAAETNLQRVNGIGAGKGPTDKSTVESKDMEDQIMSAVEERLGTLGRGSQRTAPKRVKPRREHAVLQRH